MVYCYRAIAWVSHMIEMEHMNYNIYELQGTALYQWVVATVITLCFFNSVAENC